MKSVVNFSLIITIAFALIILSLPGVLAVGGCGGDFTPNCTDTNTLDCRITMTTGATTTTHNYTIPCAEGCVTSNFEGTSFCREPVKPISEIYYIFFEAVAIGMLLFSMLRKRETSQNRATYTYQHGIVSGISMILFYALALLSTHIIVVYFNWMFAIIATIWTIYLYSMSFYPDDPKANADPLGG